MDTYSVYDSNTEELLFECGQNIYISVINRFYNNFFPYLNKYTKIRSDNLINPIYNILYRCYKIPVNFYYFDNYVNINNIYQLGFNYIKNMERSIDKGQLNINFGMIPNFISKCSLEERCKFIQGVEDSFNDKIIRTYNLEFIRNFESIVNSCGYKLENNDYNYKVIKDNQIELCIIKNNIKKLCYRIIFKDEDKNNDFLLYNNVKLLS